MKIKKDKLYDVIDLIGVLEKIRTKEVKTNKEHFSNLLWSHYEAVVLEGRNENNPVLIIEFEISNKHYIHVELDIREPNDETFYIKDITAEIS